MSAPKVYQSFFGNSIPTQRLAPAVACLYGIWFEVTDTGFIVGARYFRDNGQGRPVVATLYNGTTNTFFRNAVMFYLKPGGPIGADSWQNAYFVHRCAVSPGNLYQLVVWQRDGLQWEFPGLVAAAPFVSGSLKIEQTGFGGGVGNGAKGTTFNGTVLTSLAGDVPAIDVLFWKPQ